MDLGKASHLAFDFKGWRKRMGLTQAEAAERLSLSRRGYQTYEKGYAGLFPRRVPKPVIALAKLLEDRHESPS